MGSIRPEAGLVSFQRESDAEGAGSDDATSKETSGASPLTAAAPAEANLALPVEKAPPAMTEASDAAEAPELGEPTAEPQAAVARKDEGSWPETKALLEDLAVLSEASATRFWADTATREVRTLEKAFADQSAEIPEVLDRLRIFNRQATALAKEIADPVLSRKLVRVHYALARRLDIWRAAAPLISLKADAVAFPAADPKKLLQCLTEIETLLGRSPEGAAWRDYLLVDALKQALDSQLPSDPATVRSTARRALTRLTQTPLTPQQRKFVSCEPMAAYKAELRRWAAEPVSLVAVLRDLERYESSGLPSDAARLALDCRCLALASPEWRPLAERIDLHYRNADFRIAVTEELLNKLIPERNLEYSRVRDRVLGYPVQGESLMASEVAIRMQPDPNRIRLALEVRGEIAAMTTADTGPAKVHSDSESSYLALKPLEIDDIRIRLWPAKADAHNETRIRRIETPLDGIPVLDSLAKSLVKTQAEQSKSDASREVRGKIAAQARKRIDDEARARFAEVVERMNHRVFDPLNTLSLDPRMISAETTEERFTMRMRLAGEEQLGGHTPRPEAFADSLASVQIHESAINNAIERLLLNGRTFTLPELSQHIADRLNRPTAWEVDPDQRDVKITFADADAAVVRCRDGQVSLTLSIDRLSQGRHRWKNFQVRVYYRPETIGRSARLVREGPVHLPGQTLNTKSRMALSGIFSHVFSKEKPWNLVPEPIVEEKRLGEASITQFVIDDGWIGLSLGPRPIVTSASRGQRQGM